LPRITGKIEHIPDLIAAVLGSQAGTMDELGKSRAQVVLFEDYVLKIRPENGWDTEDTKILRWFAGKGPVPQVAAHAVQDGLDWLLMTRVRGWELCRPEVMKRPALLLDCMAEALHTLWAIPAGECPFERTVADNLAHAEATILAGQFDASDCEPETFGPGGFADPKALLDWLKENKADLILLDYDLPVMPGPQILEKLRSGADTKETPVMILTGQNDRESIMRILSLCPADYLLKNIGRDELRNKVAKFLK
jgi:aminoglycoside phosphotransferase